MYLGWPGRLIDGADATKLERYDKNGCLYPTSNLTWIKRGCFCECYLLSRLGEEQRQAVATVPASRLVNQKALADYIEGADTMRRQERFDEAERLLADALEKLGEHPKILISSGWVAYYSGQYEEALKRWSRVRALAPRDPIGYSAAVAALQKLSRLADAEMIAGEGLRLFPNDPAVILNAAWTAHYLRNWNDAAERWHKLVGVCPKLLLGYINGAEAYRQIGAFRAAEAIVVAGLEKFPKDHDLLNAHTSLMSRGRKNFGRQLGADGLRTTTNEQDTLKELAKLVEGSVHDTGVLRSHQSTDVAPSEINAEADGNIDDRSPYALHRNPPDSVPLTIRYGDHLFINGDSNDINGQHSGLVRLPELDKAQWLKLLHARRQELVSDGASFLFLLAPDKQTVYRHLLPKTDAFRLAAFLTELPYVVDVAPICAALAHFVDVYPRADSHWNHLGALLVVQTLLARLDRNLPDLIRGWGEYSHRGDLGSKLIPPESAPRLVAELREKSSLIYDNCVPNNGRVRVWAKPLSACGERKTRLALFGDSFAYDLVHFLKEVFDIVLHVHAFSVDYRLTKAFSPELVISEITERFVLRVPNPGDGEPLAALWQEKIDRLERLEIERDIVDRNSVVFPMEATRIADFAEELFAPFRPILKARS